MLTNAVSASVTRPANTTTFTAGDVVSDTPGSRLAFTGFPQDTGEGILIESAVCISNANVATKPDLELWLFDTDVVAVADNAAFAPTDTELESLKAIITFPTASFKVGNAGSGATGNAACVANNVGLLVRATTLYGVLVIRNAYVPVDSEKFTVVLTVIK